MRVKKTQKNSGFTLIELLVSISIFVLILTVSLGSMLTILNSNKKAQSLEVVMSNVNFAMESLVRHIRFGYAYSCSPNCNGTSITLTFRDPETSVEDTIMYRLVQNGNRGYIERTVNGGTGRAITGENVDIERLVFDIRNNPTDVVPSVHILVEGYAGQASNESRFTLQTLASQR